ncbi:MAG: OmpA family protein [Lutibacter sp.]|uniref:OmpA/MotB family protein n=1 Tax=Lutibacter sp. TaxID=1925666 RepID=UPI0017AF9E6D|nr:OmpA family protein [Lutibacter sp.]MBT8318162.1 OmpA family protein [Lutibacter sp.]NNJ59022.1 OmpA family protein [Lutibacter sp.]
MKKILVFIIGGSIMLSSCVSQKKYTELEGSFNKKSQELVDTKADLMKCRIENEGKISSLEQQVIDLRKDKEKTLEYVDNLTVLSKSASDNIKETLAQMGKKDEYITYIQKAITRKDSINIALGFKLKKVLKDGFHDEDIQVDVEKTVVYISIADKLLFKSGSSTISNNAKDVLGKVAEVIAAQPDLEVMVEGYTDNKKVISNASIKDNWDLSVKRSTSVIRVLQNDFNIDPARLVAAGRSEYKPLESNDTVEGRARNRRTRIVLMPKLEQFFDLLENKVE